MAESVVGSPTMSALLDGHWYDAVAGLLDAALSGPEAGESGGRG